MFELGIDALLTYALYIVMPPALAVGGAAFALGICIVLLDALKAMITHNSDD